MAYGLCLLLAMKKAVIPIKEMPALHAVSNHVLRLVCSSATISSRLHQAKGFIHSPALDTPANNIAPVLGWPSSAATVACSLDAWDEEDPTATEPEVGCNEELWFEPEPELEPKPDPGVPVGTGKSVTLWVIVVVLWYKVVVRKVVSGVGSDVGWIDSIRGDMMRAACGVRNCS